MAYILKYWIFTKTSLETKFITLHQGCKKIFFNPKVKIVLIAYMEKLLGFHFIGRDFYMY